MKIRKEYVDAIQYTAIIGWIFILFLVSMNYLNLINEVIVRFGIYSLFMLIVLWKKPTFNLEFILLLAFTTSYFFIYIQYRDYSKWSHIELWFGAPMMYFMGKNFITPKSIKFFKWLIYAVVFGLFMYASLNMIDYVKEYAAGSGPRIAYDFWVGHMIGAPLMGVYITPVALLLTYNLFHLNWKKDLFIKIVHFISFGLSVYFTILLQNRSYFFIVSIVFVLMFLLQIVLNKFKMLKPTFIAVVFIGIIYFSYKFNVFGIQTFIVDTAWYTRVIKTIENGILIDGRFTIYPLVRDQFKLYPLGGYQMDLGGLVYAHNLWLDILYAVGRYPFFIFVGYTLLTITTIVRINFNKHIDTSIKILISSVYLGFTLNFMVEPIIEGVPYVLIIFCLVNGATYEYLKMTREKHQTPTESLSMK